MKRMPESHQKTHQKSHQKNIATDEQQMIPEGPFWKKEKKEERLDFDMPAEKQVWQQKLAVLVRKKMSKWKEGLRIWWLRGNVSQKNRDRILITLSMLIESGQDYYGAIQSIAEDESDRFVSAYLEEIAFHLNRGENLSTAFEKLRTVDSYYNSLVRIGETSGTLPEQFTTISDLQQKNDELKANMQSASLYPLFIFILFVVVFIGMILFVVPQVASSYAGLGIEIPRETQVLVNMQQLFLNYGYIVIPTNIIVLYSIYYFIFRHKKTRWIGENIVLALPVLKELFQFTQVSRFSSLMHALLKQGIAADDALALVKSSTNSYKYRKLYTELEEGLYQGKSLGQVLVESKLARKIVPSHVKNLITTAEKSGNLAKSMNDIDRIYTQKSETASKRIVTLIEPILIVVIWLGIAAFSISIISPIYQLTSQVSTTIEP